MNNYQPHLNQPYLNVRNQYDAFMNGNTSVGSYNQLSGSIYNLKSSYQLPNQMYNAVNAMQNNAYNHLGGLEQKFQ